MCLTVGHHGCARRLLLCYACRGAASHVCLTVGHHGCARPLGPPTGGRRGATAMSLLVVDARCIVGAWHDKSTAVWGLPHVREIMDLTAEEDGSYSVIVATDGANIAE